MIIGLCRYRLNMAVRRIGWFLACAILALAASIAQADHEQKSKCAKPIPHPKQCLIKGNISRNGYIYHVPGKSRWYSRTCINKPGERWFCTEQEARKAGWRAPLR